MPSENTEQLPDGRVTVTMTFETAMNIRGLIESRLQDNLRVVNDHPELLPQIQMGHSTMQGYQTVADQITQQVGQ